jgi:NAD-dependent oxidoreductase involved in siderophore biosynthesis
MTPEQRAIVEAAIDRAEQACRYVLKQNEESWSGQERSAYHQGFEDACEVCARAVRTHILTHVQADLITRKDALI